MKKTTLKDMYRFPGFRPLSTLTEHPSDPKGYVLRLQRRQKKQCAAGAIKPLPGFAVNVPTVCAILMPVMHTYTWTLNTGGLLARTVTL
jgi:hypothetical protein